MIRLKIFLPGVLVFCMHISSAQRSLHPKDFTPEQRAEWDAFVNDHWRANGNGTCMPMMEVQIDSGKCDHYVFYADVHIDGSGKIKKVKLIKSKVHCQKQDIQKDLLECFLDAMVEQYSDFKLLKGKIIRNAEL